RCLFVSSTEGAYRQNGFHATFAGQGQNWLGDPNDSTAPAWLEDLAAGSIPHRWTADVLGGLWDKRARNSASHARAVAHRRRHGELRAHPQALDALCDELAALLVANGYPELAAGLAEDVRRVIEATAANYSSMYQDVHAGRRTEITYLLGHACSTAALIGLKVPHLDGLHRRLQTLLDRRGLPRD